jgi:hypothetical protein
MSGKAHHGKAPRSAAKSAGKGKGHGKAPRSAAKPKRAANEYAKCVGAVHREHGLSGPALFEAAAILCKGAKKAKKVTSPSKVRAPNAYAKCVQAVAKKTGITGPELFIEAARVYRSGAATSPKACKTAAAPKRTSASATKAHRQALCIGRAERRTAGLPVAVRAKKLASAAKACARKPNAIAKCVQRTYKAAAKELKREGVTDPKEILAQVSAACKA